MNQADFPAFSALLADVASLYPTQQALTATRLAMMFRALAGYELSSVRAALDAHLCHATDCRFFPLPGQLIAHMNAGPRDDGYLALPRGRAERPAAVAEKLGAATSAVTANFGKAWALKLKAREEAGEQLTLNQRQEWRRHLPAEPEAELPPLVLPPAIPIPLRASA